MDNLGNPLFGNNGQANQQVICDHPNCGADAAHRAPKGRASLNEHFWFCLEHVREYNKKWNYCAGLSDRQIENEIRNDTVWRRPTWPMGNSDPGHGFRQQTWFRDDFGVFEDIASPGAHSSRRRDRNTPRPSAPIRSALHFMGLEAPVTLTELKSRYKELVKRLHPDANGGDKVAEDQLKDINQAYATLKSFLAA